MFGPNMGLISVDLELQRNKILECLFDNFSLYYKVSVEPLTSSTEAWVVISILFSGTDELSLTIHFHSQVMRDILVRTSSLG